MKTKYRFHQLSQKEIEFLVMVLDGEIHIQSWYSVLCSKRLGGELIICVH